MTQNNQVKETTRALVVEESKRFSVSSDTPIYNGLYDEYQILVHDANSIDLESYRISGVPLLKDHDPESQLGTVELNDVEISNGKMYVKTIVWRNDEQSQTYKKDFETKAIRNVSVRARMKTIVDAGVHEDKPLVRAIKWSPVEISLVSIPADNNVGINRSDSSNKTNINIIKDSDNIKTISSIEMTKENQEKEPMFSQEELQRKLKEGQEEYVNRMNYINDMADTHDLDKDVKRKLLAETASKEQVLEAVVKRQDEIARSRKNVKTGEPEPIAAVSSETYDNGKQKYDLIEVFRSLRDRDYNSKAFGYAREVSKELSRGVHLGPNSIMIPFGALIDSNDMTPNQYAKYKARRDVARNYATASLTPTTLNTQDFIDALYHKNVLLQLGINTLSGLQGNFDIGAMGGKSTTKWMPAPESTPAVNEKLVAPAFDSDKRALTPRRLGSLNTISNFNINQSPYSLETIVRRDMMNGINEALQDAVFQRVKATNGPSTITELLAASNIKPDASDGTAANNGVEVSFNDVLDLIALVGNGDGIINRSNTALVTSFSGMIAMYKVSTRNTYPLLSPGSAPTISADGVMSLPVTGVGERLAVTNSVPNALTRGTAKNAFDIFFGDFSQLYMGMWGGGIQVALGENADDFAGDRMSIRAIMTTDITLRNKESFAVHQNRK